MEKNRILLADSSIPTRILLANTLETRGFEVVAVTINSTETLEKCAQCNPDIALIDLKLDGIGGIEVVRALTRDNPDAAVVMLMPEDIDNPDIIVEAVRAGAKAYIKKTTSGDDLKGRMDKLIGRRAI